jgi:IS5 family transposase
MEHRNALIIDAELSQANSYAEREVALKMLKRLGPRAKRRTVAADKGYDAASHVQALRDIGFTPHIAPNTTNRKSAIDGRTTRHAGHATSQRIGKRIEEPFGWIKTVAGRRKLRYIGEERNRAWFLMASGIYNVIRIAALDAAST